MLYVLLMVAGYLVLRLAIRPIIAWVIQFVFTPMLTGLCHIFDWYFGKLPSSVQNGMMAALFAFLGSLPIAYAMGDGHILTGYLYMILLGAFVGFGWGCLIGFYILITELDDGKSHRWFGGP